ncbi:assembly factor cbp4 [Monascus purpureus]|uniref:Cytochrome b mRNA-processing protein 4 n=1 Tax=Monascus purpureus TaxID=5098 RepID=A0A507R4S1_MONPU|nr:assembly factor cbp4 [Monascus purpureus]BDD61679.1 assembly factor cbp4 [Monascus purpureus]
MSRAGTWFKMLITGTIICVGGPAFVQYIRPTDEELFQRYNKDIQKQSLEEGPRRAKEFDDYVNRLKEWSKSDKSIWIAAQEQADREREQRNAQQARVQEESKNQRDEMRKELLGEK